MNLFQGNLRIITIKLNRMEGCHRVVLNFFNMDINIIDNELLLYRNSSKVQLCESN